jgi:signal peptidase II
MLLSITKMKIVNMHSIRWAKWLGISAIIFVLDQITKYAMTSNFADYESRVILPFFNLVLTYNKGAAFSFLDEASGWQRYFFIIVTIIISAVLLWMMRANNQNRLLCSALALVIGGAMGNLYDRVLHGQVTDFIQIHAMGFMNLPPWPAFNIADSAICVGAALLIWDSFRGSKKQEANV